MLQAIRNRAQGWIAWAIIIVLIIPFALWGINQYFEGGSTPIVATVNDLPIKEAAFQRMVAVQREQMQQMLGENFTQFYDEKIARQEALNTLIDQEVLGQAAEALGLRIDDAQLDKKLSEELFGGNAIDPQELKRFVREQGDNMNEFRKRASRQMAGDQLRHGLVASAFIAPKEFEVVLQHREQTRDLGYMVIPKSQFMTGDSISDAELKTYYEKNTEEFKVPEQVAIEYIELSLDALAASVTVTENDLQKAYEQQAAQLKTQERRRASHILLPLNKDATSEAVNAARKKAEELVARARKGESFAALAKQFSQDPGSARNGGDLGFFERGVMDPAFENAAFALQQGAISDPVQSSFGFHIIQVTGIEIARQQDFAEARAQLATEARNQMAEQLYFEKAEQLNQLAFDHPDSLAAAAKAIGATVQTLPPFTRTQGVGVALNPHVRNTAFSEDVLRGNNSEPIEIGPKHVIVLRVNQHIPATTRSFEEAKTQIVFQVRAEKALAQAKARAQALLARLKQGEAENVVAASAKVEWKRLTKAKRSGGAPADLSVIQAGFKLPRPTADKPNFDLTILPSGDAAIVAVYAVQVGDPALLDAQQRLSERETLLRVRSIQELTQFRNDLRSRATIDKKLTATTVDSTPGE